MATIDAAATTTIPDDVRTTLRMGLYNRADHVRENLESALARKHHDDIAYWTTCGKELAQAVAWLDGQV